jgi:hypothetical protein
MPPYIASARLVVHRYSSMAEAKPDSKQRTSPLDHLASVKEASSASRIPTAVAAARGVELGKDKDCGKKGVIVS